MKNYYCLVAGMPDVALDASKLPLSLTEFRDEYLPLVDEKDRRLLELFFLRYDNRMLLDVLEDKPGDLTPRGLYSREQMDEEVRATLHEQQSGLLPEYMYRFITEYNQLKEDAAGHLLEDILTGYYYDYACNASNEFVASWFEYNRDVNNILIALTARHFGFQPASYLIGDGELVRMLTTSGARDFGIGSAFDGIQDLLAISEMTDLVERERKIDMLRWNWLEDKTFFHYFSIERIYAFLLRLSIVARWIEVDKEKGEQVFRNLIQQLKDEVEVPQEFTIKNKK